MYRGVRRPDHRPRRTHAIIRIVTDSVASLPARLAEQLGIEVVSLWVNDGESHMRDIDIDLDAFYRRLADMAHLPTSSQPSVDSLVEAFTRGVADGSAVIGVFISEKMSGTAQAARLAADMVRESIPEAVIEIVDARSNSMQEGFVAVAAAKAALAGESLEGCLSAARDTIARSRYLFTPASLEYLRRGGRIGSASALLGQLLQIRPILTVENGETATFAKVRTQARALSDMASTFAADVSAYGFSDAVVHYIADRAPAEEFARDTIAAIAGREVEVVPVSPVIGLHVGPAVGLVYVTQNPLRP